MCDPDSILSEPAFSFSSLSGYSSDESTACASSQPKEPEYLYITEHPANCRIDHAKDHHSSPLRSRRSPGCGFGSILPTQNKQLELNPEHKSTRGKRSELPQRAFPGRMTPTEEDKSENRRIPSTANPSSHRVLEMQARGGRGAAGAKGCRPGAKRHHRHSLELRERERELAVGGLELGNLTFKTWGEKGQTKNPESQSRPQRHGNMTLKMWGGDVPEDAPFIADTMKSAGTLGNATIKAWGGCVPPDELFEVRRRERNASASLPVSGIARPHKAFTKPGGWRGFPEGSPDPWAAAELGEDEACVEECS